MDPLVMSFCFFAGILCRHILDVALRARCGWRERASEDRSLAKRLSKEPLDE